MFCKAATILAMATAVLAASTDCQAQADACRSAPNANQATCSAQYAACLGSNPYANNTFSTSSTSASSTATATLSPLSCQDKANACRSAPDANQAQCSAEYAACLGYNPYSNATVTTEVVTAFTTYCPAATTLTYNQKTYTISSATTLTITDCPCTLTRPVAPPASSASSTYSPCQQVYNSCVVAGNGSPNLAACAASSYSCAQKATATAPAGSNGASSKATVTPSAPAGSTGASTSQASQTSPKTVPTTTGSVVQFTGAASVKQPVVGLLALGALAFL